MIRALLAVLLVQGQNSVGPFPTEGLNHPLGLPIGPRRVATGSDTLVTEYITHDHKET